MLHRLKAMEYNGLIGLLNSDLENERYQVLLQDGSTKNIKKANLKNIQVRHCDPFNKSKSPTKTGYVASPFSEGRYGVMLQDKAHLTKLKPENLKIVKRVTTL